MIVALLVSHKVMQVTISSDEEEEQFDDGNTSKSDELSDKWSSDGNSSEEDDESKVKSENHTGTQVVVLYCILYLLSLLFRFNGNPLWTTASQKIRPHEIQFH